MTVTNDIGWITQLANMGTAGMFLAAIVWLVNRWAPAFLLASQNQTAATSSQADAIRSLVVAVQQGQGEQHEVLLAVRAMARQLELMEGRK